MDCRVVVVVLCVVFGVCEGIWSEPMDGEWSPWSQWFPDCDYVSPGSVQSRSRMCNNPPPINGGLPCTGHDLEEKNCPIHGGWSAWSAWSQCNNQCGNGARTRARECSYPTPMYDGARQCDGDELENKDCLYWNFENCLGECYFCALIPNSHCESNITLESGFRCACDDGYTWNNNTGKCDDIDECVLSPGICGENKWCENVDTTYRCFCNPGFKQNVITKQCEELLDPVPCHIVRNNYICGCMETDHWKVTFDPKDLTGAPSPVTIQNGTFKCSCHFCKQKLSMSLNYGKARCVSFLGYAQCKEQLSPEQWGYPVIPSGVYQDTKLLEKIDFMTLLLDSASNMSSAQFNVLIKGEVTNVIDGCLNANVWDDATETKVTILQECDQIVQNIALEFDGRAPKHNVYTSSIDPETGTIFRFSQHLQDRRYTFWCDSYQRQENYISIPNIAFRKDRIPVFSSCILNPDQILKLPSTLRPSDGELNATVELIEINSALISATSWPRMLRLPEEAPITVSFKLMKEAEVREYAVCVWYDFDTSEWREDGCRVHGQNHTHVTCFCNHLTNFAVAMKEGVLSTTLQKELEMIIEVGLGTCLIPSGATLIILLIILCAIELTPEGLVRIAVTLCLILGNICILVASTEMENQTICKVVAMAIHVFYTAIMAWLLGLSCYLYVKWCRPVTSQKDKVLKYLPIMAVVFVYTVIACTGLAGQHYQGFGHVDFCWPGNRVIDISVSLLMTVLIPGIFAILILLCTSCTATKYFDRKDNMMEKYYVDKGVPISAIPEEKRINRSTYLEGMYMVTIVHGLMWIFYVVYMKEYYDTPMYLFSFLNSMEGFCIFLFFVVMNPEMKTLIALIMKRKRPVSPQQKIVPIVMPEPEPEPESELDTESDDDVTIDAKFIPTISRCQTAFTARDVNLEYQSQSSSQNTSRNLYDPMDRRSMKSTDIGRESRWTVPGDLLEPTGKERISPAFSVKSNNSSRKLEPMAPLEEEKPSFDANDAIFQTLVAAKIKVNAELGGKSARPERRTRPDPRKVHSSLEGAPPPAERPITAMTPGPPKPRDGWAGQNDNPKTPAPPTDEDDISAFKNHYGKQSDQKKAETRLQLMRAFNDFM